MVALEAEIDRLEGWVRGGSTGGADQSISGQPISGQQTPAALDAVPAEVAFLRQQLEALQRYVAAQTNAGATSSAPRFTCAPYNVLWKMENIYMQIRVVQWHC